MDELIGDRNYETATLKLSISTAVPDKLRDGIRELTGLHVLAEDRRKGYATALLRDVCLDADMHAKTLLIFVRPYIGSEMTKQQLRAWYARLGFQAIQEQPLLMARPPGSTPRMLTPIAHAAELAVRLH